MDFSTWSPSHTIIAIFAVVGFIGQVAVLFYRTGQLEKQVEKQTEAFRHVLERQGEMFDKRIGEVNQQIGSLRTEIVSVRADTNQQIGDLRTDMNQHIGDLRREIAGVREEISRLNQNHIEHLTHHNQGKEGA